MPKKQFSLPGFTFIELLLYSTLVTILLGAFFSASWILITTNTRDRERHSLVENERFINDKIEQLLYGATSAQTFPSTGSAGSLTIQRSCTDLVVIDLSGTAIRLGRNSDGDCDVDQYDTHYDLSNSHAKATSLQFSRVTANGQSAIRVQATLQGSYETRSLDNTVYFR